MTSNNDLQRPVGVADQMLSALGLFALALIWVIAIVPYMVWLALAVLCSRVAAALGRITGPSVRGRSS